MPNSITAAGLITATPQEIRDFYVASFQSIYGPDINLASDTPDGQLLNIFVQSVIDLQDLVVQVYNTFDPDNAIGVILDQRVAINGIQRQAGTYTTTNVDIVTNQSLNLYGLDQDAQPVYTVADNAGNEFNLITTVLGVSPGTNTYLFRAAEPGQVLTVPNTINVPVTSVLGVVTINNPNVYVTLGINEESDMDLKIRREKSVSLRSQGYLQGLLAALENINGVDSAFIYENTTDGPDIDGIPGHSIWVIIAGTPNIALSVAWNSVTTYNYGEIASDSGLNYISIQDNNLNNLVSDTDFWQLYNPIPWAIYNYRNAGCGIFQSNEVSENSYVITQIDGTAFTIYWDSVVQTDLYIKFTAASLNNIVPSNYTVIKSYLLENFMPGVFEEVNINGLSTLVQQADPNTLVTNSGFSLAAGGSYTVTLEPSAKNFQFVITDNTIIILPIILTCPNGLQNMVNGVVTGTVVTCEDGDTIQFTALGGYQGVTPTWSMFSGTGSVDTNGLYTSSGTGTDVVRVTDSLSNIMDATITVL